MPAGSSSKRPASSPALIPNPFIKRRNLEWTLQTPPRSSALSPLAPSGDSNIRDQSTSKDSNNDNDGNAEPVASAAPSTAAVESGAVQVRDHLAYFINHLSNHVVPPRPNKNRSTNTPILSIPDYQSLYEASAGSPHGAHFVIHQHDHPVAGTHYDLRLQINETSSVSWAIMYGLPGDPHSVRLNRNATETRIHSLWNHLIETASPDTGSLLIWDTGTYSILPRKSKHDPIDDPSSPPGSPASSTSASAASSPPPQALLHAAFQNRKIRIQLRGTKLPDPYVIYLRLTKSEDAQGRAKSAAAADGGPRRGRRRRQGAGPAVKKPARQVETSSDSGSDGQDEDDAHLFPVAKGERKADDVSAMEAELRELEDDEVRRSNAYPGSSNTIGSIHQRKWYLSLDRPASGFAERKQAGRPSLWEMAGSGNVPNDMPSDEQGGTSDGVPNRWSYPFYVRGPDHETSVVTGRRAEQVLSDEGVAGFVHRKGWNPVVK